MSITVCWAAKGGSGTTVVTAMLALACRTDSLLVDLDGELPAVLGVTPPTRQGVADWLCSDAPASALDGLAVPVDRSTSLVPRGTAPIERDSPRWSALVDALDRRGSVFVDAGSSPPPPALHGDHVRRLLVTRACYLALCRASALPEPPDGVVLVAEPWRTLRPFDVERACRAPVVARVSHDPAVPRAIDSGLLNGRLPRGLLRELRGVAA